ncbi:glycosyl hydrolase family 61-domain-containing protein [Lactarius quietus]|nr:glycosyl hydrolase family 61-domain-containing protein [Lactarius quietus]
MLPQFALALAPILALLPSVAAHGYVTKVVIDGTTYYGNLPQDVAGSNNSASPIRQIYDIGPVKGADNPDINCGLSAQLASMVVPANPGSSMEFYWGDPGAEKWPHNTGPFMTYMASCGNTTCDKFNGSTAQWFKIDEIGKKPDGTTWYQQDVMNGSPVTLTLPPNIAPGGYLVRQEIIALHLAVTLGGAEFYPSCTQINVGGSQTGTPNQTVTFPGAYSDNDPGIYDPSVFDAGATYIFPGPPVSNLASATDMSSSAGQNNGPGTNGPQPGQTSGNGTSSAHPASSTATGHSPKSTSTSSGSGSQPTPGSSATQCKLQKRSVTLARRSSLAQHKAQLKRRTSFMRAIFDAVRYS